MSELRYLTIRTIFDDSHFAKMITGFTNVFHSGCSSLFTWEMVSYCSNMSTNLLTMSCKFIGTLLARCF